MWVYEKHSRKSEAEADLSTSNTCVGEQKLPS